MTHRIIGVMSGSSLDGLDMALCVFEEKENSLLWQIHEVQTVPYVSSFRNRLNDATILPGKALMKLDAELGDFIGNEVSKWITENKLHPTLIASHGHTVFHAPAESFTTQIGSGAHIAARTGIDTMVDFRMADVAHGGQGAPFAPVVDRDLFAGHDGYLNLGGIANVSLQLDDHDWKGWDICPCNQALNFLANQAGKDYDENGMLAKSGTIQNELAEELMRKYPVSKNFIYSISNEDVLKTWNQNLRNKNATVPDLLATTTLAIAKLIVQHITATKKTGKILVTGGGAHNSFLLALLNKLGNRDQIHFETPDAKIIDFKECLLMAYLGYCTLTNKSYGMQSITGAASNSIGGALYKAIR